MSRRHRGFSKIKEVGLGLTVRHLPPDRVEQQCPDSYSYTRNKVKTGYAGKNMFFRNSGP